MSASVNQETIRVPQEVAQAYNAASPAEREKMAFLMGFWLNNDLGRNPDSLLKIMKEIGEEAQKKGMTPEILEEILGEPVEHLF